MRIISGEFKGRKLESPPANSLATRPTADRVKEAMFSILAEDIYGAVVADFFSGTGSLGLEALSRGAEHCFFVDSSLESVRLIKRNIAYCRADARSTVLHLDFNKAFNMIKEKIDIILADPPYDCGYPDDLLEIIAQKCSDSLSENSIIMIEHAGNEKIHEIVGINLLKTRRYGKTVLSIFQPSW